MKKVITIGLIILLAVFMRLYRIETNAHFQADEARDLVNIHQIFVEKKITLVGPISDDGSHLFSSLTYYLLLPFAVFFEFDPMGTVVGAVVWGLITFGVFWLLAIRINPKMLIPAGILAAVWWPLVETSRWPWNPNLVPLWIGLSIYLSFNKDKISKVLSGLSAGLSLHHHFLAIVAAGFVWLRQRSLWWVVGIGAAIMPFILFDWRHPPGLFLSKMILYNNGNHLPKLAEIIPRLIDAIKFSNGYLFPGVGLTLIIFILILAIFVWDIKNKSKNIYWGVSAFLTLGILMIYSQQFQYLLGTVPLVWMWLIGKRKGWGKGLAAILMVLIVLSSIMKFGKEVRKDDYKGNIRLITGASEIIKQQIDEQKLQNANLAVLGSIDLDRTGKTYRGVLLTWNVKLKNITDYNLSDNLFVITQKQVTNLQGDGAAEIDGFRNGPVKGIWKVGGTNWQVVQFNRY